MNKKIKSRIILIIFLLILVGFVIIISLNLNYFNDLINSSIKEYGLIAILVFSFFADLIEQPFGPEVPASIGLLLGLNIFPILIFSIIGSYIASLTNFYIGRRYLSKSLKESWEEKVNKRHYKLFHKYGQFALVLAAISPMPWVAFCWLAGSFKMKLRKFIIFGLIPRAARILTIVLAVKYLQMFLF